MASSPYTPSPARSPPRAARNSSHSSAGDIEDEFDRLIGSLGRLEKPSRDSDDWLASAANDWIDQVEAAGEEDYLDEYDREPSPLSSEDWLDDYDEPLPPLDGILVARALLQWITATNDRRRSIAMRGRLEAALLRIVRSATFALCDALHAWREHQRFAELLRLGTYVGARRAFQHALGQWQECSSEWSREDSRWAGANATHRASCLNRAIRAWSEHARCLRVTAIHDQRSRARRGQRAMRVWLALTRAVERERCNCAHLHRRRRYRAFCHWSTIASIISADRDHTEVATRHAARRRHTLLISALERWCAALQSLALRQQESAVKVVLRRAIMRWRASTALWIDGGSCIVIGHDGTPISCAAVWIDRTRLTSSPPSPSAARNSQQSSASTPPSRARRSQQPLPSTPPTSSSLRRLSISRAQSLLSASRAEAQLSQSACRKAFNAWVGRCKLLHSTSWARWAADTLRFGRSCTHAMRVWALRAKAYNHQRMELLGADEHRACVMMRAFTYRMRSLRAASVHTRLDLSSAHEHWSYQEMSKVINHLSMRVAAVKAAEAEALRRTEEARSRRQSEVEAAAVAAAAVEEEEESDDEEEEEEATSKVEESTGATPTTHLSMRASAQSPGPNSSPAPQAPLEQPVEEEKEVPMADAEEEEEEAVLTKLDDGSDGWPAFSSAALYSLGEAEGEAAEVDEAGMRVEELPRPTLGAPGWVDMIRW